MRCLLYFAHYSIYNINTLGTTPYVNGYLNINFFFQNRDYKLCFKNIEMRMTRLVIVIPNLPPLIGFRYYAHY